MATERQALTPGGPYVNETTDTKQYLLPNGVYINETTAAAAGGAATLGAFNNVIYRPRMRVF